MTKDEIKNRISKIHGIYLNRISVFNKLLPKTDVKKHHASFNLISELHLDNKNMYENAHTRVLAAILNYDNKFLESFLKRCGVKHSLIRINGDISIDVERQYTKKENKWIHSSTRIDKENTNNCRPDCLVWKKDQFAIIIENKINGAPETKNQVDNYIAAISGGQDIKLNNNDLIWVIYLGGDSEDMPSEESLSTNVGSLFLRGSGDCRRAGNHLRLVSYKNVIIPWLEEDVLPICPFGMTSLTGGLQVYIDYLKKRFSDSESEENIFFSSKEVISFFLDLEQQKQQEKVPFYKVYNDAKDFVNLADDDTESILFFKALKHYYLNHHFRFNDPDHNKIWTINATGSYVYIWKKTWNKNQARIRSIGDIYFELFPYQIDTYLSDPEDFKLSVTCSLKYKGKDERLFNSLIEKGVKIAKNGDHDHVFNKAKQKKGNQLYLESDGHFFDWFVKDSIIKEQSKKIDDILKKFRAQDDS